MNELNYPVSIATARLGKVIYVLIFLLGSQLNCGRHELDSISDADAQRKAVLKVLSSAISDPWSVEDEDRTQMLIRLLESSQIGSVPVIWRASLENKKGLIVKWIESGNNAIGIEIVAPTTDGFNTRRYPLLADEHEWQMIMKGRLLKHICLSWDTEIIPMPIEGGATIAIYDCDGNVSQHISVHRSGFE